jgi:hypothetical protein
VSGPAIRCTIVVQGYRPIGEAARRREKLRRSPVVSIAWDLARTGHVHLHSLVKPRSVGRFTPDDVFGTDRLLRHYYRAA